MEYIYPRNKPKMEAGQLADEIESELGYGTKIRISPEQVWIQFESELTPAEKSTLDILVAEHETNPPPPDPNEVMAQYIDDNWETGIPTKADLLKKAVKHLLGYPEE